LRRDAALGRRELLQIAARSAAALALPAPLLLRCAPTRTGGGPVAGIPFTPLAPSRADTLQVAPEFTLDLVAVEGDPLGVPGASAVAGDAAPLFGGGCDHTAFFPLDLPARPPDLAAPHRGFVPAGATSHEGLLVVNHEGLTLELFHPDWRPGQPKEPRHVLAEQRALGMSVLHVRRDAGGAWRVVSGSPYVRRIDATTPHRMTGPAAAIDGGPAAIGTFANCSGGRTPWGTALSCEENFHEFIDEKEFHYRWPREPYGARRHYGWVVEVDPFDPAASPRKHTALGRCRHENIALRVAADGTLAAYLGDDRNDGCLYKFVAAGKVTGDRAQDRALLESGRLYVAQLDGVEPGEPGSTVATRGRWLPLDFELQPALRAAKREDGSPRFASQADVLADVAAAAQTLGATPLERPEDAEVHPHDGSPYIALTNQKKRTPADWHGRIVRLVEAGDDPAALTFAWSVFAEGSAEAGVSSPDNLAFDADGNLWVTSDRSSDAPSQEEYDGRGNNGLYFLPTSGPHAGMAFLAAIGPVECELTGPCFAPDGKTLFLSVQHPGEESESRQELTSHWPDGGATLPRGAVVAIRGIRAVE